ncbi:MAG: hypothetical protein ACSLFE_08250 [Gemmatimonadaceae bacterium]
MTRFRPGQVIRREVEIDCGELGKRLYTVEISASNLVMREKGKVKVDGEGTWREVAYLLRRWSRSGDSACPA